MKNVLFKCFTAFVFFAMSLQHLLAQQANDKEILLREYNLVPNHSLDTQYYTMESRLTKLAYDGTRQGTDIYRLYLRCVPGDPASEKGDEYTCLRFTYQLGDTHEKTIPSLTNWQYFFTMSSPDKDDKKRLFGIDHSKFEHLVDDSGKAVPLENTFYIYNAFVDFYTMSVFAEKTDSGKGVQDLKRIGDKIIHNASYSNPSEDLGSQVAKGSHFQNGEITLAFKGLSLVNHKTCALLGYDSGESSFDMIIKPMPAMEVKTKGSSHYFGDIYKDLDGGWIQKAILHEFVVSQTAVPGMADKINSVVERTITINNVAEIEL